MTFIIPSFIYKSTRIDQNATRYIMQALLANNEHLIRGLKPDKTTLIFWEWTHYHELMIKPVMRWGRSLIICKRLHTHDWVLLSKHYLEKQKINVFEERFWCLKKSSVTDHWWIYQLIIWKAIIKNLIGSLINIFELTSHDLESVIFNRSNDKFT